MKFPCVSYHFIGYISSEKEVQHIILIWKYNNYQKEKKQQEPKTIGKSKNC